MKNKKRIIRILCGALSVLMILPFIVDAFTVTANAEEIVINQTENKDASFGLDFIDPETVNLVDFEKKGTVLTISNNYNDDFYLKKEFFSMDGSYYSPAIEKKITKDEFEKYYTTKAFDIADIKIIVKNKTNGTLLNVMFNKNGELLSSSYAGVVIDGSFAPITIDSVTDKYSWILAEDDKYYQCVTDPKEKQTVKTEITKIDYNNLIFNKTYTYSRIIKNTPSPEGIVVSDESYDPTGKRIGIPTVVRKDDAVNIAELFFMVNKFNEVNEDQKSVIYAMDSVSQYIKQYAAPNDEASNEATEATTGDTAGLIPQALLEKYTDIYTDWMDDYNKGYFGTWLDPAFSGQLSVQEWEDPFWTQDIITHRVQIGGLSYGYYDDLGNYIKVSADGKVVPNEPGSFDGAGNFSPENSVGYYDPSGIYHPVFEKLKDPQYDFEGNFHIGEDGYFDGNGIWHSKNKTYSELVLFDGRVVYTYGVVFNPKTQMSMPVKADMWGKFYIGEDEIVYPDSSVFNTKSRTLTYSDGNQYKGEIEDFYYLFGDNSIISKDSYEKGKKESVNVTFPNGTKMLTTGTIQYPNGITYGEGSATLPNSQKITDNFSKGYIDVSNFGYIYPNGHVATINEFGDLITDTDSVIFPNGYTMFANGDFFKDGSIFPSYTDANGNVVSINGVVVTTELQIGSYNELGVFVPNILPVDASYYDRTGAKMNPNGAVILREKIGGYDENGKFVESILVDENSYYTVDGHLIVNKNSIEKAEKKLGFYDKDGNFVMNDGKGYFDVKGTLVTGRGIYSYVTSLNGLIAPVAKSEFVLTMDGDIQLLGQEGYYDETGLITIGREKGYYDENGRFIISKINPHQGYFYDAKQNKHSLGTIYRDSDGILRLLKNPSIGLEVFDGKISTSSGTNKYSANGIVSINGVSGFYNSQAKFVKSDISPYLGGFYDVSGLWVDSSYYTDPFGTICNNNGGFNYMGNYVTPVGDMGSFDVNGKFLLGISSKSQSFFYNDVGGKTPFDNFYRDEFGMYKNTNGSEVYDVFGNSIVSQKVVGLKLEDYIMVGYGLFLDGNGNLGYFSENGTFAYGRPMYKKGFLTPNKGFISFGVGDASGKSGNIYYIRNKYYVVNGDNGSMYLNTCDGYSFPVKRVANKYFMFSNGTLLSDSGDVGYFDVGGIFKHGFPENMSDITMPPEESIGNNTPVLYDPTTETTETPSSEDGSTLEAATSEVVTPEADTPEDSSSSTVSSEAVEIPTRGEGEVQEVEGIVAGKSFKTLDGKYIIVGDGNGYYLKDGTYMIYSGLYGYFEKDGEFVADCVNPYKNGFYTWEKTWVPFFMSATPPNKGYYNKFGMPRNGNNPFESGFYDYEGSWHPVSQEYFIDYSGNAIKAGDDAIGYFSTKGRYYPYSEEQEYYDVDGTYYNGNKMVGYFSKNKAINSGKNPSFEGFYDKDGNWHIFGDKGYYTEKGLYIDSVTDEIVGYFNEVGEFTLGYNPYVNGYNDFNGNWSSNETNPLTVYFEIDGTPRVGLNPYAEGYYDMFANWHPYRSKGYFDKHGTLFSIINESIGYYDSRGNYREGTNPYQHGYYDEDRNLRLFEHDGYFTKIGTYIDESGEKWHFTKDKLKKKGENIYKDGFYDSFGNWYPWNENGCYTSEGVFFPTLLIVDKYKVDSANYILFEGKFKNPDFVPSGIKNTIQFTLGRNKKAPLLVDTGIKVSQNAMISYSNAKDLFHNISIYSNSTFIEDNNACIVIIDGRIINLQDSGKMSIKELRDKFIDSDVEITVARSRVGERYALADSIEIGKKITLTVDNKVRPINNPMIVKEGIPYISMKDISEIIAYDVNATKTDKSKIVTFTLRGDVISKVLPKEIMCVMGNVEALTTNSNGTFAYHNLRAPLIEQSITDLGGSEVYVPVYILTDLTGKNVEYDTKLSSIVITSENNELPFADN